MKSILSRHRHKLAILIIVGLLAAGLFLILLPQGPETAARQILSSIMTEVRKAPFPLFIVLLGVLPLFGVPVTAFYLAAGAIYIPVYGAPLTFAGIGAGLIINLILSYWYARAFRGPVNRILNRFATSLPDYSGQPVWKLILIVRFTPGLPQLAQNFLLGILGVPLGLYLALSFPAEMIIAFGYTMSGSSFATGHWHSLLYGVAIIALVLLVASLVNHRRSPSRGKASAQVEGP